MAQPARKLAPVETTPESAATDKVAAAAGEITGEPKQVEWRGITLELPAELPPVVDMDRALLASDPTSMSLWLLLQAVLGEDQFVMARNMIARLPASEQIEAMAEMPKVVLDAYGTTSGE